MASNSPFSALSGPTRELVLAVAQSDPWLGKGEEDKSSISDWISKIGSGEAFKSDQLQSLESTLVPRTYLVGNEPTAADVALYATLHPVVSKLTPPEYYGLPAIIRYFDHIQNIQPVKDAIASSVPSLSYVSFDLENAPKLERKAEPPKKKDKKEGVPAGAEKTKKGADVEPVKEAKKEKKEPKDKSKKDAAAAPTETSKKGSAPSGKGAGDATGSSDPVPSMIDLRVGHIVDVKKHPDADGLYVEQIDLGEETGPRTVVSGLVNYIPIEQMRDKYLVAVCNLKPANMRGIKSFAMVLCATSKDGKEGGIEILDPPKGSKPGDRVYFEGEEYENATPLDQLNPKKKIFETIQPGFITLESREAAWINPVTKSVHRIRTKDGVCVAPSLVGASLS